MQREERRPGPIEAQLRAEALDLLRDARRWRLSERRWATVRTIVGELAAAMHSGDVDALRECVYDLELAGPVRATPMDGPPVVDPPDDVVLVLSRLVHELDPEWPEDDR